MPAIGVLSLIVANEALTRGLADPEARMLIEWLVEQAERLAAAQPAEDVLAKEVTRLCRRARALARFVSLWCHEGGRRAACQLAAVERFAWELPTRAVDPCELMQEILFCEGEVLARGG
ncbi:MAG TPA: hypothetical protein VKA46_03010 [Gemmataceae bacterium]|nr:hypothetical protein [Gemmataceae bacterium]